MKLKAAVTVDARTKEYAAKLSSASDLREPSLDMKSSTGIFDKKFLSEKIFFENLKIYDFSISTKNFQKGAYLEHKIKPWNSESILMLSSGSIH